MATSLLTTLIFFLVSSAVVSSPIVETYPIPSGGAESFVFDSKGTLFTGVNDGRILQYKGPSSGWEDFANALPTRTKEFCDGKTDMELGKTCGRTLGLGLHHKTGRFYLADRLGLYTVGPEGSLATLVVSEVEGLPLKWLDGLDVDQNTGYVYFTDLSSRYNFSQYREFLATGDATGRVIEYNPNTKTSRVLLNNLEGVGGIGCSPDSSYILISEFTGQRITKYWLKGPKANTWEIVLNIQGPTNIKLTPEGEYWIAANINGVSTATRINENGKILEQIQFYEPYNNVFTQEFHFHGGKLYISAFQLNFVGVYDYDYSAASDSHEEF